MLKRHKISSEPVHRVHARSPSKDDYASHIETVAIADLHRSPHNARTHTSRQIKQIEHSIEEFGFTNPVLVDEANQILAGHGRTIAAERLGWTRVPTIRIKHLSDAQKPAYIIADNQLAA